MRSSRLLTGLLVAVCLAGCDSSGEVANTESTGPESTGPRGAPPVVKVQDYNRLTMGAALPLSRAGRELRLLDVAPDGGLLILVTPPLRHDDGWPVFSAGRLELVTPDGATARIPGSARPVVDGAVDGEHVLWFEDSALLEDPEARTNGEPPDPPVVHSYDRRTRTVLTLSEFPRGVYGFGVDELSLSSGRAFWSIGQPGDDPVPVVSRSATGADLERREVDLAVAADPDGDDLWYATDTAPLNDVEIHRRDLSSGTDVVEHTANLRANESLTGFTAAAGVVAWTATAKDTAGLTVRGADGVLTEFAIEAPLFDSLRSSAHLLAFDSFSGDENATGRSWLYDLGEHTLVDLGAAGEWPSVYLDESQVAWSDGRQLRRATWAG